MGEWPAWRIKDELGFEGVFSKGTEILVYRDGRIKFVAIENLKLGDKRVVNFEYVPEFDNDKLNHHSAFTENFVSIKCEPEEIQQLMCDGLTAMMMLKEQDGTVKMIEKFDSKNIQEIYLIDILEAEEIEPQLFFYMTFNDFSFSLKKNKNLSSKSKNRYYNYRRNTIGKRWLEKMRSKVFCMKKDNVDIKMELKHESDQD